MYLNRHSTRAQELLSTDIPHVPKNFSQQIFHTRVQEFVSTDTPPHVTPCEEELAAPGNYQHVILSFSYKILHMYCMYPVA